jgi:hypothetical protein
VLLLAVDHPQNYAAPWPEADDHSLDHHYSVAVELAGRGQIRVSTLLPAGTAEQQLQQLQRSVQHLEYQT